MECSAWVLLLSARMERSSAGLAVMEAKVSAPQVRAGEHSGRRGSKRGLIKWEIKEGRGSGPVKPEKERGGKTEDLRHPWKSVGGG